jgi:hypothetical protein
MDVSGQLHAPARFTMEKKAPIADRKGACVGPRVSLDVPGEGQHLFAPTGEVVHPVPYTLHRRIYASSLLLY